jgi:hypothetical protein
MHQRYRVSRAVVVHAPDAKISEQETGKCTYKWDAVTLGIDYSTPDWTTAVHAH